ncbi:MAG: MFS transporter [Alphaproteobacteria bacterium]|nr:MAG: MFS transporter [Alphaproteobacteria bacterium]
MSENPDKKTMIRRGWCAVALGSAFFCYQFIVRVFPNILHDELMDILNLNTASFGVIISAYGWAYALMQLPLGLAIDRWGPRYLVSSASLLCAIGCLLFIVAKNIYVAWIGRFLMGMGSACGFMSCVKLATLWLPTRFLARAIALTMLCGTLGAVLGGTPLSLYVNAVGPHACIVTLAGLGVVMGLLLLLFIPHAPPPKKFLSCPKSTGTHNHPLVNLKTIMLNPQSWIIGTYSMLMYVPITVWGEAWGVPFVERATQSTEKMAAMAITCMFAGAAAGSPLFTAISDLWRSRRFPMVLGSVLALATNAMIVFIADIPLMGMYVLFFLAGLVYTAKILTFSSICEIVPRSMSGVSVAMVNAIVMMTGPIYHPLVGHLIESHATRGGLLPADYIYTYMDYHAALYVVPLSTLGAFFLAFFIKETHPDRPSS